MHCDRVAHGLQRLGHCTEEEGAGRGRDRNKEACGQGYVSEMMSEDNSVTQHLPTREQILFSAPGGDVVGCEQGGGRQRSGSESSGSRGWGGILSEGPPRHSSEVPGVAHRRAWPLPPKQPRPLRLLGLLPLRMQPQKEAGGEAVRAAALQYR